MVRRGRRMMYVDESFFNLCNELKFNIEENTGKKVYTPDVTQDLTLFLHSEKLVPLMKRRVQDKRRFFL